MATSMIDMQSRPMDYLKNALQIGTDYIATLKWDKDGNITGKIENHSFFVGQYDFGPKGSLSYQDLYNALDNIKAELGSLELTTGKDYSTEIDCIEIELKKLDAKMDEVKPIDFGTNDKDSYSVRDFAQIFRSVSPREIELRSNSVYGSPNDRLFAVNYVDSNNERRTIADIRVRFEGGMSADNIRDIFKEIENQAPGKIDDLESKGLISEEDKAEAKQLLNDFTGADFEAKLDSRLEPPEKEEDMRHISLDKNSSEENFSLRDFQDIFRETMPKNLFLRIENGETDKIFKVSYRNPDNEYRSVANVSVSTNDTLSRDNIREVFDTLREEINDKVDSLEDKLSDVEKQELGDIQKEYSNVDFEQRIDKACDIRSDNPDSMDSVSRGRIYDPNTKVNLEGRIELKDELKNTLSEKQIESRMEALEDKANRMLQVEKTLQRYEKLPYRVLSANPQYFFAMREYQNLAIEYDRLGGKTGEDFAVTNVPSVQNRAATFLRAFSGHTNVLSLFTGISYEISSLVAGEGFDVTGRHASMERIASPELLDTIKSAKEDINQLKNDIASDSSLSDSLKESYSDALEKILAQLDSFANLSEKDVDAIESHISSFKENVDNLASDFENGNITEKEYTDGIEQEYRDLESDISDYSDKVSDLLERRENLTTLPPGRIYDPRVRVNEGGKIELRDDVKAGLSKEETAKRMGLLKAEANHMLQIERCLQKYEKLPYRTIMNNPSYYLRINDYQRAAARYERLGGKTGLDYAVVGHSNIGMRISTVIRSFCNAPSLLDLFCHVAYAIEPLESKEHFIVDGDAPEPPDKREEGKEPLEKMFSDSMKDIDKLKKEIDDDSSLTKKEKEEEKSKLDGIKDRLGKIVKDIQKMSPDKIERIEKAVNKFADKISAKAEALEKERFSFGRIASFIRDVNTEFKELEKEVDHILSDDKPETDVVDKDETDKDSTEKPEEKSEPTEKPEEKPDSTEQSENEPDPTDQEEGEPDPADQEEGEPDPTDQEEGEPDPTDQEEGKPDPTDQEEGEPDPTDQEEGEPDPTDQEEGESDPTDQEEGKPDPTDQKEGEPDSTDQEESDSTTQEEEESDSAVQKEGKDDSATQNEGENDSATQKEGEDDSVAQKEGEADSTEQPEDEEELRRISGDGSNSEPVDKEEETEKNELDAPEEEQDHMDAEEDAILSESPQETLTDVPEEEMDKEKDLEQKPEDVTQQEGQDDSLNEDNDVDDDDINAGVDEAEPSNLDAQDLSNLEPDDPRIYTPEPDPDLAGVFIDDGPADNAIIPEDTTSVEAPVEEPVESSTQEPLERSELPASSSDSHDDDEIESKTDGMLSENRIPVDVPTEATEVRSPDEMLADLKESIMNIDSGINTEELIQEMSSAIESGDINAHDVAQTVSEGIVEGNLTGDESGEIVVDFSDSLGIDPLDMAIDMSDLLSTMGSSAEFVDAMETSALNSMITLEEPSYPVGDTEIPLNEEISDPFTGYSIDDVLKMSVEYYGMDMEAKMETDMNADFKELMEQLGDARDAFVDAGMDAEEINHAMTDIIPDVMQGDVSASELAQDWMDNNMENNPQEIEAQNNNPMDVESTQSDSVTTPDTAPDVTSNSSQEINDIISDPANEPLNDTSMNDVITDPSSPVDSEEAFGGGIDSGVEEGIEALFL